MSPSFASQTLAPQKHHYSVCLQVVKQTVMTRVYGVTRMGMYKQVRKNLQDDETFPQEYASEGANYIASQLTQVMLEMFSSSTNIQVCFYAAHLR